MYKIRTTDRITKESFWAALTRGWALPRDIIESLEKSKPLNKDQKMKVQKHLQKCKLVEGVHFVWLDPQTGA